MPLRRVTIAVLGAGTMGQALIRGLLAAGVPRRNLRAAETHAGTRRRVAAQYRITVTADAREAVRGAHVVMLAVKPQQMADALAGVASALSRSQLVISIAAGLTLRWLERRLSGQPVIRVMPNLPTTVGYGFAAMAAGWRATATHRRTARAILAAVGEVVELPERQLDAITAVSGSGPAYVFFLVEAWEQAARRLGLAPHIARAAVRQTLCGSLAVLDTEPVQPGELVQRVASKRGTTEAALKVLARRRVAAHFREALRAAARRSRELSR